MFCIITLADKPALRLYCWQNGIRISHSVKAMKFGRDTCHSLDFNYHPQIHVLNSVWCNTEVGEL
jgi:hypothetical protein